MSKNLKELIWWLAGSTILVWGTVGAYDLSAAGLEGSIGLTTSFHQGPQTLEYNDVGLKGTLGLEEQPVYLWGSLDSNETGLLGQPFSRNDILGFGLGVRKSWGDFSGFVELGYADVDQSTHEVIQQEVVYTQLVGNHNVYNRPVPVVLGGRYDQTSYDTRYDIKGGLMGRVGVAYELREHWSVTVAYRYFEPEVYYSITGQSIARENFTATWEENTKVDMNAIELGVVWAW